MVMQRFPCSSSQVDDIASFGDFDGRDIVLRDTSPTAALDGTGDQL